MKLKLALYSLATLLLLPNDTSAASAIAATDNTGLFVITFDFIAGKEDYRIPIGATRGLAYESDSNFIGYDVVSGASTTVALTKAAGIVLSNQKVVDGLYYEIKAGKRASFTFFGIATVPETATTGEYQAILTNIPHFSGTDRIMVSEERLDRFKSDTTILNKVITGQTLTLTTK